MTMRSQSVKFNYQRFLLHLAITAVIMINIIVFVKLLGGFGCVSDKVAEHKCTTEEPVKLDQVTTENQLRDYLVPLYQIGCTVCKNF